MAVTAPGPLALQEDLAAAGIEVQRIPMRVCWLVQSEAQPLVSQAARAIRYSMPDRGERERAGEHVGEVVEAAITDRIVPSRGFDNASCA